MSKDEETESTTTSITRQTVDYNTMNLRLNTDTLILNFERFISGEVKTPIMDDQGNIQIHTRRTTNPPVNEEGQMFIIGWVSSRINVHMVQGNFPLDKAGFSQAYENYIYNENIEFLTMLLKNQYKWDIDDTMIQPIIAQYVGMLEPYFSRTIGNEERKGLNSNKETSVYHKSPRASNVQTFR